MCVRVDVCIVFVCPREYMQVCVCVCADVCVHM